MKAVVFGLGNVGLITSVCLANEGCGVVGCDIHPEKINDLKNRRLYLHENGLSEIFEKTSGERFSVCSYEELKELPRYILICVGTPAGDDGQPDLSGVVATVKKIAELLRHQTGQYDLVLRSTVPPGTSETLILPVIRAINSRANCQVNFHFYPEFLRAGRAIHDFSYPSLSVWAGTSTETPPLIQLMAKNSNLHRVSFKSAEMIKYLNNSFHALKVAFSNEMAILCQSYGVDLNEVFELFLSDKRLNISEAYLRPGFAFGGSCLVKELKALKSMSKVSNISLPLMNSILTSNEVLKKMLIEKIESYAPKTCTFLGLTFKPGTNDLRDSPLLDVLRHFNRKTKLPTQFNYFQPKLKLPFEFEHRLSALNSVGDAMANSELLVLGPHKLSRTELDLLAEFKHPVIDLQYFNYKFKNKPLRFRNIFDA